MHYPPPLSPRTFRPILRSIGLLDIKLPRNEIISTDDRRTDKQTDRRTDGQTNKRRVRQQQLMTDRVNFKLKKNVSEF